MGNHFGKLSSCLPRRRHHDPAAVTSDPCFSDEGLGHSFCYVRPDTSSKVHHNDEPNPNSLIPTTTTTFKSISGASVSANSSTTPLSSSALPDFDCSHSFSSVALQPFPRLLSGPLPLDRGSFLSGPIDNRGFMSGPIDRAVPGLFSGPLRRSFSARTSIFKGLRKAINVAFRHNSVIAPAKSGSSPEVEIGSESDEEPVHWAQGRAGEDRVHVVVSEDHGWVFVGIYDGFNGPDAPDYLLSELYPAVQRELKGLLWEESARIGASELVGRFSNKKWKSDWEKERSELDRKLKEQLVQSNSEVDHSDVLEALSRALLRTEEAFLDVADSSVSENPELALMGSCVLVMLMKGEDVYVMNVGDSRVILAKKPEPDVWNSGKERCDLERISEENSYNQDEMDGFPVLEARQLTMDHSTCIEEEVQRIRKEHPEDDLAVSNDRVKGSLKVTRAFGAGFLKQPNWNNALLEMFRIDYVGTSPYITCNPSLRHHRLGPKDRFILLSSDGLYQYFTNQQAVAEVELFISMYPEGDPAQHLVEEVLLRAAKQAGMDFHELLEIPQGDRRRYHDDVSIIVISLEGRIWRSSV